jgi:UDP-N-acetylglucosamine 2-epimerase (non-hydrolysing)
VDHCSALLFAPTKTAFRNLMKEGIRMVPSFMTGDTMVDALLRTLPRIEHDKRKVLGDLGLEARNYGLLTLHRPSNVDDPAALKRILKGMARLSHHIKVLFPIHPHTHKSLTRFRLRRFVRESLGLTYIKPLSYTAFIAVLREASVVLTDSGGVQKEAFLLRTPCITLRETTEWPETLEAGANVLVGSDVRSIERHARGVLDQETVVQARKIRRRSPFGDGRASTRIAKFVAEWPPIGSV